MLDPREKNTLHSSLLSLTPSSVPTSRKLNIVKSNEVFPQGTYRILSQDNQPTVNNFMHIVEMNDASVVVNNNKWTAICNIIIAIGDGDAAGTGNVPKQTYVIANLKLGTEPLKEVTCKVNTDGACTLKRKNVFHAWKRDAGFDSATFTITDIISEGYTYRSSFNNVINALVVWDPSATSAYPSPSPSITAVPSSEVFLPISSPSTLNHLIVYLMDMNDESVFVNKRKWKAICKITISTKNGNALILDVPTHTYAEAELKVGTNPPERSNVR